MPERQLKEALDALHRALESEHSIQDEDREALVRAAEEIADALAETRASEDPDEQEPLSDRVSALIEDFEVSYPRVAEVLAKLSEALSNLGI